MNNASRDVRQFSYDVEEDGQSVQARLFAEGYSKRLIIALKQTEEGLRVSGHRVRSTYILKQGETLTVTLPQPDVRRAVSNERVPVLYEDDDIIVYNKPAGLVCHRSGGHYGDTLENTATGVFRAMNRLDKETSGALVAAKHQFAAAQLWQGIDKRYIAVVQGEIFEQHGFITLPLARQNPFEPRQVVCDNGKHAITEYHVLAQNNRLTVLECILHTGRMHQIRVHFSEVGHPLLGDAFYGGETSDIQRQALHCDKVTFGHPVTKKRMCLSAPLTDDMAKVIEENGIDIEKALVK